LDGSNLAEQALPCAVMLARGLPAELVLFRALSIPPDLKDIIEHTAPETIVATDQMESAAHDYLGQVVNRLQEADLSARAVVKWGSAAEAIVDFAEQIDVQQIVMSTHGYSGISRWKHGSVAERVLQSAGVPVLVVRAQEKPPDDAQQAMVCRRILVPLDGSSIAEQALPPAISIARGADAEITLFRVTIVHVTGSFTGDWYLPLEGTFETASQIAQAYLDRVAERLQGIRVSSVTQMGAVANAIIEYAEDNQVDLIAMCTRGRTGFTRWALGSVADRVLRACHIPLLLVRAQ
jgi:nucleotide-binding universal stress UspA family protein